MLGSPPPRSPTLVGSPTKSWRRRRAHDRVVGDLDQKALAAHRESEHFKKHAVAGLYQKMRERSVENLLALV